MHNSAKGRRELQTRQKNMVQLNFIDYRCWSAARPYQIFIKSLAAALYDARRHI